ncbi:hypothetical protein BCR33DRAFT_766805 [Rhizoclosmatium globosum]|uniref:SHSP domain-containing protein n=1 Tax=Rhizoclosmatium globosum TaxID=329046 RepID=A0A1Y2C7Z7_9FUNG|nr:hypothetical protein BCR33DRAFT_766805 [Rhizoclosmatium globosum]|eukprot:ORY43152.1 hypothetical protein BCR33DRAFT_766805 [Rhizoclosmatium globosum]
MLSLAILDILFTLFLVKVVGEFVISRIQSSVKCHAAQAATSAPTLSTTTNCQSSQQQTRSCPFKAGNSSQCQRRSSTPTSVSHPFHQLFPQFQVVELDFLPSVLHQSPRQPQQPVQPSATTAPSVSTAPVVPPVTPVHTFTTEQTRFVLTVEVPGFSRSQLTTTVTDDLRQIKVEGKNGTRKPVELTVTVPRLGDLGAVSAVLEDGILTVVIPKVERDGRVVNVVVNSVKDTKAGPVVAEKVTAVTEKTSLPSSDDENGYVVA